MGIFYSTCSTQSMRREEERQRQRVEGQGQVEEEERREATRELIRKTEKLEILLQQRPSAAELIEKNIIPRSVIDAGEATWQVPDRKTSHSGAVAKRTRASKKRRETYSLRLSKTYHKPRDPVSILEEAMAPKKKEGRGGKAPAGTETNSGPTGRIAVGPFNIENLKDRKQEIKQKHSTSKKRFTPDTPGHVKFLHTKFRQVFQPFQSNPDKYADRNQTKTRSNQKAPKNSPTKD